MARYDLVTILDIDVRADRLWDAMIDPVGWADWWRWLDKTRPLAPTRRPGEVGARYRLSIGGPVPYRLAFEAEVVRAERPHALEARITGALEGSALWRLEDRRGGARASLRWTVAPTPAWMRALEPVARPLFSRAHAAAMRDFGRGVTATVAAVEWTLTTTPASPHDEASADSGASARVGAAAGGGASADGGASDQMRRSASPGTS